MKLQSKLIIFVHQSATRVSHNRDLFLKSLKTQDRSCVIKFGLKFQIEFLAYCHYILAIVGNSADVSLN